MLPAYREHQTVPRPARPQASARSPQRLWRWAAVPFGVLYLIFLAIQFGDVISATNLDADAVSAPVIGQLLGAAGPHANVVLGEFGWYATLLFELATKWLPAHIQVWEAMPYAMALAGVALAAWSVWQVAGAWAAGLTAVLLVCAAPDTLHLLLSMTQHAPDWFCLGLLAAFVVLVQRRALALRPVVLIPLSLVVGLIVGMNAASDPLLVLAGLVPFVLAVLAAAVLARGPGSARALRIALATLVVAGVSWVLTLVVMSALNVAPEAGVHTTTLATAAKIGTNFRLWWQSIAVLGNGDFFGLDVSFVSALAVACAALSIGAVAVLPRVGWRALRLRADDAASPEASARLAFMVFWCSSAIVLSAAFVLSATPVDIHGNRYLIGLIYAAAAVIPVIAAGRVRTEAAAVIGTCVFALSGVIAMAKGTVTNDTNRFPTAAVANQVWRLAVANHLQFGYSGYWDAAPITWASHFRVRVYPVSVCVRNTHLCPFDLHTISSWYTPHPGARSFLLTDSAIPLVPSPTPDLGGPSAVYHVGNLTMYVYPYDLATRIVHLR
jgi:hypothetical protein